MKPALKQIFNFLIYLHQNLQVREVRWKGTAVTAGGTATFFPTNNNTAGGAALFTVFDTVIACPQRNTSTAIQVPQSSIKTTTLTTVVVNVVTGTNLLALGNTQVFAPDGLTVYLEITGR